MFLLMAVTGSILLNLCVVIGMGHALSRLARLELDAWECTLVGFLGVGGAAMAINFLAPLSAQATWIVGLGGAVAFAACLRKRRPTLWEVGFAAGFALVLAFLATRSEPHYDTGLYHHQALKWLRESAIPFGLVHLHGRLATNSAWISTAAGLPVLGSGEISAYSAPLVLAIVFVMLLATAAFRSKDHAFRFFCSATCIYFMLPQSLGMGRAILSPTSGFTTDGPAALFAVLAFAIFARAQSESAPRDNLLKESFLITVASVLAILCKPSYGPMILLPAMQLALGRKRWVQAVRPIWVPIVLVAAFGVFWIGRNWILSGCLAYPLEVSCFPDSLPWAATLEEIRHEYMWIKGWARRRDVRPEVALASWDWFRPWLSGFVSSPFVRLQAGVAALAIVLLIKGRKLAWESDHSRWSIMSAIAVIGVAAWFLQAPLLRFGFGFFVMTSFSLLVLGLVRAGILPVISNRFLRATLAGAVLSLLLSKPGVDLMRDPFLAAPKRFPAFPEVAFEIRKNSEGALFYTPRGTDQCWELPLPCTPYFREFVSVKRRGSHPEFRWMGQ